MGENYNSGKLRSFANRHKSTALAALALELAAKTEQHKARLEVAKGERQSKSVEGIC